MGTVHIKIPHHNYGFDIQMRQGENFMTSATEGDESELLGEYLECACGGNMSCSTCHVILDEDSFCEAELDMLDLAYEPTETSRLGCQISMSKGIDGITVTIPAGANNLWS
jgi:ferredoxin